jgi:hypothetical protein
MVYPNMNISINVKYIYFIIFFSISFFLFNYSSAQIQPHTIEEITYESVCKGTILKFTYDDKIEYIADGDLADNFTYEVDTTIKPTPTPSSTRTINF